MKRQGRERQNIDDKELEELQNADNWDFDTAEIRQPVKHPRAVVSVAFQREDFERVATLAQRHNMRMSEYIRKAALGGIAGVRPAPAGSFVGSATGVRERNFTGPGVPYSVDVDKQATVREVGV